MSDALGDLGELGDASLGAIASGSLPDMQAALVDVNAELDMLTSKLRQSQDASDGGIIGGGAAQLIDLAHNAEYATQELGEFTEADRERRRSLEKARETLEEQIGAQQDAQDIAVSLLVATEGLTEGEAEYELSLRRTNGELQTRADLNQSSLEANLDLADGLAALTEHEDGWKASLNGSTQAGRDNIREVIALIDDIQALGVATMEQTGSQEQANAAMQNATTDLLNQAAAGYSRDQVQLYIEKILGIPDEASTYLDVDDNASPTINEVLRDLDDLPDYKRIDIRTVFSTVGDPTPGQSPGEPGFGVLLPNADGNLYEDHQAEIAPGGAWRLWAEPETGGEAYIPLAPSRRPRSMRILEEVAREFGAVLTTRACGGIDPAPASTALAAPLGPRVVQYNTINYPISEPTSVATNRALQYAAEPGV